MSVSSPHATRARRPGWRDPRLALGVVLVAASGLLGARALAHADDSVEVWALVADKVAGQTLSADDLEVRRVRFSDADVAQQYVGAGSAVPDGSVLTRDVTVGELLPRSALGAAAESDLLEVPLSVPATALPATTQVGSRIDVWVTPKGGGPARLVLDDAPVVALAREEGSLDPSANRQVIVALDPTQQLRLPQLLSSVAAGTVVVTRQASG